MEESSSLGAFGKLGEDFLFKFLVKLEDAKTLEILSCCSKQFRFHCLEEAMWQRKFFRDFQGNFEYCSNWRATYFKHVLNASTVPKVNFFPNLLPRSNLFRSQSHGRWQRSIMNISEFLPLVESIPRVQNLEITDINKFCEQFDGGNTPVVITNAINNTNSQIGWKLSEYDLFDISQICGENEFPVQSPQGCGLSMRMKDYISYMTSQRDEEPLYIFNGEFAEIVPKLAECYDVPEVFSADLFNYVGDEVRPDYRWFVVGPERSGARWHVDPTCTSAWNALTMGRKRWALYPPNQAPPGVEIQIEEEGDVDFESPSSLQWFLEIYPHLNPHEKPLELVQKPGEIIFIPGGWWHCVLNLEITVAITQNFVSWYNFDRVVQYMSRGGGQFILDQIQYEKYQYLQQQQQNNDQILEGYSSAPELGDWFRKLTEKFPEKKQIVRDSAKKWVKQENWTNLLLGIVQKPEFEQFKVEISKIFSCGWDFPMKGKVFQVGSKTIKMFLGENVLQSQLNFLVEYLTLQNLKNHENCQFLQDVKYSKTQNVNSTVKNDFKIAQIDCDQIPYLVVETILGKNILNFFSQRSVISTEQQKQICFQFGKIINKIHKAKITDFQNLIEKKVIQVSQGEQKVSNWNQLEYFKQIMEQSFDFKKYVSQQALLQHVEQQQQQIQIFLQQQNLNSSLFSKQQQEQQELQIKQIQNSFQILQKNLQQLKQEKQQQQQYSQKTTQQLQQQQQVSFWRNNQGDFWCSEIGHVKILKNTGKIQIFEDLIGRLKYGNWYPFVSYLRWLRTTVIQRHKSYKVLSQKLIDQLEEYLPQDPIILLYIQNREILNLPVLCHGDLTYRNVLLNDNKNNNFINIEKNQQQYLQQTNLQQEKLLEKELDSQQTQNQQQIQQNNVAQKMQSRETNLQENILQPQTTQTYQIVSQQNISQLRQDFLQQEKLEDKQFEQQQQLKQIQQKFEVGIIDFGDSGVGDFLYDFVAVFVSSLQAQQNWFEYFLEGYGFDKEGNQNRQQRLSYICMCYSILHEECVLGRAMKLRKELREIDSLREFESQLWGFLNIDND